ncbi:molybdopterin synthase sulfur carrier subunit [Bordetella genomosp. 5]|uniref:MoaD/ThiS family protein n=1 Tax=Bordetella genomosp. 5 TaxID=1395608 RepID=UPI000B9ED786|nr:MoaD/ThiS family protein [Bordetella genomosp. 5]OZI46144.1 molybdopterin synthase sulfur carrier subunit [Bordetella genomosp. 5]
MNGATIDLLYFARIAELTGKRSEVWPLAGPTTGTQLLAALTERYPQLGQTRRLKLAINQTHAKPEAVIAPGDEVAVFEPVTGG